MNIEKFISFCRSTLNWSKQDITRPLKNDTIGKTMWVQVLSGCSAESYSTYRSWYLERGINSWTNGDKVAIVCLPIDVDAGVLKVQC